MSDVNLTLGRLNPPSIYLTKGMVCLVVIEIEKLDFGSD